MSRDIRFRYSVEMTIAEGYMTPAGWPTRRSQGLYRPADLLGTPTAAKLARFATEYNLSIHAGGANAHLGERGRCIAARIIDHDNGRAVVAVWSYSR